MMYRAVTGITITLGKRDLRIEPGEMVPPEVIRRSPWLLTDGHVEAVTDSEVSDGANAR